MEIIEILEPLFTLEEVAKYLRVSEKTVRRLIDQGLRAQPVGSKLLIERASLVEFMQKEKDRTQEAS